MFPFCVSIVYLVAIHDKSALAFVRIDSEFRVPGEWTTVKIEIYESQTMNTKQWIFNNTYDSHNVLKKQLDIFSKCI